jgi:heptose I phosphotransferase
MVVLRQHEALMRSLGLADLPGARAFRGELVKNHRGRREIFRIRAAGPDGIPRVFYFKRILAPYKKDGLRSLLRHGRVRSMARQEWENALALQSAGFGTAPLIAMGEDCGLLWERFSYLITESVNGERTLLAFLTEQGEAQARRQVLDALAAEIRRLHDAGLATPDLFSRHIFLESAAPDSAASVRFSLIDVARLDRGSTTEDVRRARDLAMLNISIPMRLASPRERVRFLRLYAGSRRRRRTLASLIARHMTRLLTRSKFRKFFKPV